MKMLQPNTHPPHCKWTTHNPGSVVDVRVNRQRAGAVCKHKRIHYAIKTHPRPRRGIKISTTNKSLPSFFHNDFFFACISTRPHALWNGAAPHRSRLDCSSGSQTMVHYYRSTLLLQGTHPFTLT